MTSSLTDTQRMILTAAAARDERLAFPFPKGIRTANDKLAQQAQGLFDKDLLITQTGRIGRSALRDE